MKILRRTVLMLILLVLLIPASLLLVFYTEQGSRALLGQVERLAPVKIDYGSGSLSGRLSLQRLRFETDDLRLEMHSIVTELSPECLWRGALCLRTLQVGDLDLALLPTDVSGDPVTQLIEIPFLLEVPSLDISSLRVHWSGGEWRQASFSGSLRLYQASVDILRARIESPQLTLQSSDDAGVAVDEAADEAMTLPVIDLPLILSVYELELIDPIWNFYGAEYRQEKIAVRGQWQRTELRLDSLKVHSRELGKLSLAGDLAFAGDWPLEVTADIELAEPLQVSGLLGNRLQLSAAGDFSALALQITAEGTVDVAVEAEANLLDAAMPFRATATANSTGDLALVDIANVPQALHGVEIRFPWVISASGSLEAQQFGVSGAATGLGYSALSMTAKGQYAGEKLEISNVSLEDDVGKNTLAAQGEILMSSEYSWSLAVQSDGLDLPALNDSVRGRIDGVIDLAGEAEDERWQIRVLDIALQGQVNEMPASISGYMGLDSELRLSASALQARLNGTELSVQSPGDDVGPGHLHLQVQDISAWRADSQGQIAVDAEVSADRERIKLSGRMQNLVWDGLRVGEVALAGDVDTAAENAFQVETKVSDLVYGDYTFAQLRLSGRGDGKKQSLALSSRGDIEGELRLTGTLRDQTWQGSLAPTRLQTPLGEWVLAESVAMRGSLAEDVFSFDQHCWRQEYAQLCPGNWSFGPSGGGSIQLRSSLEVVAELLPHDVNLQGDVALQLDARWAADTPLRLDGKAQTGAVTITQHFDDEQSATFGWDEADVALGYTADGLRLTLNVQRDSHSLVGLNLLLPQDRSKAISGAISVERLRPGAIKPFLPVLSSLAGNVSGEVSLSGTVDRPLAFGAFKLADGDLLIEGNPTRLESVDLSLEVQGRSALVYGTGLLGGGELQLAGRVETEPELRMELNINGAEHAILYPPSTELNISESLAVVVQRDLLELTGEVTVHDGLLEIEALPEEGIALSPSVVEVNAEGTALKEQLPFDTRMDVQIHIEDQFEVLAANFQTRLGGDLRVRQRRGQPVQVFGNLEAFGGEFRAYQTRLQVKRGTLNFTGPPTNPTVDVRAQRHISSGDVTVGVQVQGPLQDDLLLDVYSQPAMSQADAMSYLVRGRGMDAGAGLDGTSLALSLASGVVNRSELVTELNRIPGLSNVEFGAQGSEADTAATVSGYLGERLYLSYGVGLYEPVNVLTTRFYFRSRLWLEVVSSLENSLDLYYSFDID